MLNVRYNPQDILKSSKIQTCSIPGSRCKAHILYTCTKTCKSIYQWLHICVDIYLKTSVFSVLKDIKCDFNALILNFYTPPPPPLILVVLLKMSGLHFIIFILSPLLLRYELHPLWDAVGNAQDRSVQEWHQTSQAQTVSSVQRPQDAQPQQQQPAANRHR